jgi:hypothetical protein
MSTRYTIKIEFQSRYLIIQINIFYLAQMP